MNLIEILKEQGITEEQAKDRVAALAEIGIDAWYEEINNSHWINDGWIG